MRVANPARGEAVVEVDGYSIVLRPTFAALVAAEVELGPLFALVERAADGRLTLTEMVGLFWHCRVDTGDTMDRAGFGEALMRGGLAAATPGLRVLLEQILAGR